MASSIQVLYFGDQSIEPYNSIEDLLKEARVSNVLPQFLRVTFAALQGAVSALPPADRSLFLGRDFAQLVQHVRSNKIRHAAVSSVLSCVAQLGWTAVHRDRNPELWIEHVDRIIVGVCTGTLPAIAATAALSDTDLLQLASTFVPLSLRLGLEVSSRSLALEGSDDSWSVAVSGVSTEIVREELCRFNESRHIPRHKRVYVSAYLASSMTLSGPPSLLQDFLSLEPLRLARKLPLAIRGLFHAFHLPLLDLDAIIGHSDSFMRPVRAYGSLLNPKLQGDLDVPSLKNLLVRAVKDILQAPLDINDDTQQILGRLRGRDVQLTSVGPARIRHLERALIPIEIYRLDAQNVDELWKILVEGRDLHRVIPIDRFDVHTHVDATGKKKNTSLTPYGCFDERVGEFDISLFKMSPREAAQTDPMHRMMLLTAYEALESAGYYDNGDPNIRPMNSTFYGVAGDDYRQVNSGQDVDTNFITGGTRAFGPGRVNYYFGWKGPSMSIDTACSASAVAIHQAISSLKLKECDVALAGGANLLTCSDMFAGLSRAKFVCSTGPCKTFDETADGYCRADATATVVLKRLSDALRDKDNILGIIRSIGTNHAGTAISLTHPEADTQTALFERVLKVVGMDIDDIDHIELHGTGTQAGDLAEVSSIIGLLKEPRPKDRPLTISSIKPNVGHSEAASGVTSLIKGLLMLQHQIIPQHIGIKTRLNSKLPPLGDFNVVIPSTNMPYIASGEGSKRRMLVNNFNATAGMTAMLLEEYRSFAILTDDIRRYYPITLSAASATALYHTQTQLLEHLKSNANIVVSHLSYTLTARRLHHKYRSACVVGSTRELIQKLEVELSISKRASRQGVSPFGVFVFTGQASSYSGMAGVLFKINKAFRSHLLRSDALCRGMGLPSFIETITDNKANFSQFSQTQCQLALIALEIALASLLEFWGIWPKAVIGHSLGGYSALCVSKVLSLADTLYLVGNQGLLLESACKYNKYSMAAISLPSPDVEETLRLSRFSECEIACLNAPSQTVVSGPDIAIRLLMAHFNTNNARVAKLQIPYAFHSKQMDATLSDYRRIAERVAFKKPSVPLVSTLLGEVVQEEGILNPQYLCRQTREPVKFKDALHKLEGLSEEGQISFWIEVGPSPACLPMIASTIRAKPNNLVCALDPKKPNWSTISNLVSGYYGNNGNVRWDEYHKEYLDALSLLQLPSYPFELKKYWIQYDGDWVIRKNQKVPIQQQETQVAVPTLESSTLRRLGSDSVNNGTRKVSFTSNLSSGELMPLIGRSRVNGRTICPSSVYVDMALAATSYLCKESVRGSKPPAMEVSTFEICSDLEVSVKQSIQLVATQQPSDPNIIEISIVSLNHGDVVELVRCKVIMGDGEDWAADANSNAYLYQSRLDLLSLFLANGQTSRLSQPEVYQKLPSFFNYDKTLYIQEVLLNSGIPEAAATISFLPNEGIYICNPQWLETLTQIPSLVVECGYGSTTGARFTCRSWKRMHILLPLEPNIIYQVHVRMQPHRQTSSMVGDLHVFDEAGRIAAVIKQILFKRVSDSELDTAPPSPSGTTQVRILNGTADSAYTSDSRTLSPPEVDGTLINGRQISNCSKANGNNGHYTPTASHPRPISTGNSAPVDKRPYESSQLNSTLNDGVPPKLLLTTLDSPKRTPEQLCNEKLCVKGGNGGVVNFDEIVTVIAAEIGVEADSLTDGVLFDELGVDSIIQISVFARIQECLDKPLPAGLFVEHNNVAKLRQFFVGHYENGPGS